METLNFKSLRLWSGRVITLADYSRVVKNGNGFILADLDKLPEIAGSGLYLVNTTLTPYKVFKNGNIRVRDHDSFQTYTPASLTMFELETACVDKLLSLDNEKLSLTFKRLMCDHTPLDLTQYCKVKHAPNGKLDYLGQAVKVQKLEVCITDYVFAGVLYTTKSESFVSLLRANELMEWMQCTATLNKLGW